MQIRLSNRDNYDFIREMTTHRDFGRCPGQSRSIGRAVSGSASACFVVLSVIVLAQTDELAKANPREP